MTKSRLEEIRALRRSHKYDASCFYPCAACAQLAEAEEVEREKEGGVR